MDLSPSMPRSTPGRPLSRLALGVISLLLASACGSTQAKTTQRAYPEIVASSFGEMRNVSVTGSIWFGTMPSADDLELASRRGIERAIDLSTPSEASKCDLTSVCSALGIDYMVAGMHPAELVTDHCVDLVLAWLKESRGKPTLMFDGSGGRCATFLAIYRSVELSVPLEEALVEARRAGMKPGAPEEFVRAQYERLSVDEDVESN